MQIVLLMGWPGSGKGTQAALLAEKTGAKIGSPGNEFRQMVSQGLLLGKRIKIAMEAGELMPSWLAAYMLEKEIFSLQEGQTLVFESGCRIKPEAELFHDINTWLKFDYKVVYLDVTEEETKKRLLQRQQKENRPDDHSIDKRIEEFRIKSVPSVEFFKEKGSLISINGEQSIEKVHQDICAALGL